MDINLTQPEEEHLAAMMAKISAEIEKKGGWIPFSRYMEMALYDPDLGYYCSGQEKFGAEGDFITAPEITPFFGQTIVNTVLPILENLKKRGLPTRILEFGAGTGSLAKSILLELHSRGFDLDEYHIIEISPDLIQRQKVLLSNVCKENNLRTQCVWLDFVPNDIEGVILANEVLDAIPCERICVHNKIWHHLGLAITQGSEGKKIISALGPALSNAECKNDLSPLLQNSQAFPEGYTTEIHPQAQAWLKTLSEKLRCGLLLIIDYGFHEQEYYHAQRSEGTLMAHHHHRALTDIVALPGISDITTHIECSSLLRILEQVSNSEIFFSSQASYLLHAGIGDLVLQKASPNDAKQFIPISDALQKLMSEAEMGELFKVIAFGKDLKALNLSLNELPGFTGRSRVF